MKIDVIEAPTFLEEKTIKGYQCVVIDVLRATSTIITALVSGATGVRPCKTVKEAKASVAKLPRGSYLLGGEEMGENIPGFDLGNSPFEYMTREVVKGRVIYSYTTNGTGAIRKAFEESGNTVYIAALLNLSAVASALVKTASAGKFEGINILCGGRQGQPSEEDNFCAGLIIDALTRGLKTRGIAPRLGDTASAVANDALSNRAYSLEVLRSSEHGRFLESIGFADDLIFASRIDFYNIVPVFNGDLVVLPQSSPNC
jgi:2-phosphosulfolactate phosphatase